MFSSFLKVARPRQTGEIVARLEAVRNKIPPGQLQTVGLIEAVFKVFGLSPLVRQLLDSVFDPKVPAPKRVGIYTLTEEEISVADAAPGGALSRRFPINHSAMTYLDLRDLATAAMDICRKPDNVKDVEGFCSILLKALPELDADASPQPNLKRAYYEGEKPFSQKPRFDF